MAMTMTQKILADHASLDHVEAGQLIEAKLDLVMANDITGPMALPIIKQMGGNVFDKDKVVFVPDHFTPNKDIKSAENSRAILKYSLEQGLTNVMIQGKCGVEHAILPESMVSGQAWFKVPEAIKVNLTGTLPKYVSGKDVIIHLIGMIGVDGALYKSLEFTGEGVKALSMDDRFTICNMAIEAGAKNGIFPVDDLSREYMKNAGVKEWKEYSADEDAHYIQTVDINLSEVRPTVAFPHLPGNAKTIDEVEAMDKIYIDQVVIGSCTNGRLSDLEKAAAILKGHKVAPNVRVMVVPATQKIFLQAVHEGLVDIFVEAGCAFNTPSCGPCMGGHMGVLAKGEKCVSTTNRNFVGRMGDTEALIYLASPETAAASAIAGYIANPEKVGGNN